MKFFKKNNLFKNLIYSNVILLVCLILIVFFSANLIRDFLNKRQLIREVEKLKNEISNLTANNDNLANLINYLKTNDYLEEEARTKLNKKKPGEEIIIIPGDQINTNTTINKNTTPVNTQKQGVLLNNINKWWTYFFSTD